MNGMTAVISLMMGVFVWWIWYAGIVSNSIYDYRVFLMVAASVFVFGGSGFIFGLVALAKRKKRLIAIAGMLLNVSVLFSPIMLLVGVTALQ